MEPPRRDASVTHTSHPILLLPSCLCAWSFFLLLSFTNHGEIISHYISPASQYSCIDCREKHLRCGNRGASERLMDGILDEITRTLHMHVTSTKHSQSIDRSALSISTHFGGGTATNENTAAEVVILWVKYW